MITTIAMNAPGISLVLLIPRFSHQQRCLWSRRRRLRNLDHAVQLGRALLLKQLSFAIPEWPRHIHAILGKLTRKPPDFRLTRDLFRLSRRHLLPPSRRTRKVNLTLGAEPAATGHPQASPAASEGILALLSPVGHHRSGGPRTAVCAHGETVVFASILIPRC